MKLESLMTGDPSGRQPPSPAATRPRWPLFLAIALWLAWLVFLAALAWQYGI